MPRKFVVSCVYHQDNTHRPTMMLILQVVITILFAFDVADFIPQQRPCFSNAGTGEATEGNSAIREGAFNPYEEAGGSPPRHDRHSEEPGKLQRTGSCESVGVIFTGWMLNVCSVGYFAASVLQTAIVHIVHCPHAMSTHPDSMIHERQRYYHFA